ncbi:MAG: lipocalin-like domain-containing protein [Acidobacteriota bacterium]
MPTNRVVAQQKLSKEQIAQKQLVGTWTLIEAPEIRPDGSRGQTFGPNPKGLLIIDESGQYSLQIFQADRPRFVSGDKRRGTDKEYQAAVLGMSSHFGHCLLDEAHGVIIFRIEQASFPNWDGTEQKRQYQLSGDVLTYQVPAAASGNGIITISSWRRVR